MLFKNASIYRLTQSFDSNTDSLQDQLLQRSFTPCSGFRPSSFGWVPPISGVEDAPLFHEVAGCILLCARREDKVIPPSALNEAIAERVGVINGGELLLMEDKDTLMRKMGSKTLRIDLQESIEAIPAALAEYELTLEGGGETLLYTYDSTEERTGITRLLATVNTSGLRIRDVQTSQSSLEDIFVNLVRD